MRRTMSLATAALMMLAFVLPAARAATSPPLTSPCGTTGSVTQSQTKLWPPNHKMRNVTLSYDESSDDGDTLTLTVNSITSSEDGQEKGATARHSPDSSATPASDGGVDTTPPAAPDPATVT